ncbi:hypothetical protein KU40_04765 [Clostridium botulinum]|nr:hypothetical protein KU40_04765 [Clostridium botulinum]
MTTYSLFELEPIFIDFKNESYNLGLDIQANQNDTLTLNFICRNNGIEEDMSKYKVELRVHNNSSNTDYIQTQNENVTLGTDGSVKIVCQSLKGNKLTAYSGQCNGVLRIFNTENKQKATRIITMRIVADPLETDRTNICESTITKLEDLDWILNEAYNIEDEFKKAIEEAIKQKAELVAKISESVTAKNNLNSTIQTANNTNNTLNTTNTTAINTKNELNTLNTTAINTKSNLDKSNVTALGTNKALSDTNTTAINTNNILNTTINNANNSKTALDTSKNNADKSKSALDGSVSTGNTLKTNLDGSIATGTTLKNDIDNRITTGNKLKTDLDNSSTVATSKKEILDTANVQAEKNIETLNSFGDASQLTKDVTTLKNKVLKNELTPIETDSVLTKLPNCIGEYVHNMQIKGKTLQNLWNNSKTLDTLQNALVQQQESNFSSRFNTKGGIYTIINFTNKSLTLDLSLENTSQYSRTIYIPVNSKKNITLNNDFPRYLKGDFTDGWENTDSSKEEFKKSIMILEGEIKEIPSYFEGIKSVGEAEGNKISILSTGNNLFDINKSIPKSNTAKNVDGNSFTLSGTSTWCGTTGQKLILKPNTKYKISGKIDKIKGGDNLFIEANNNGGRLLYTGSFPSTFTTKNDVSNSIITFVINNATPQDTSVEFSDIQIEEDTLNPVYEPYKEDKTEILLPSPHCGLPSGVSDVVDYDKNERIKNVDKVVLNGSENWQISSNAPIQTITVPFTLMLSNSVNAWNPFDNMLSDKFINKNTWNVDEEGISISTGNQLNIRILKSKLETPDVAGFKKWLQANPTTVYYQLDNPKTEKLNIKDTLQTFTDGYIMLDNAITPCTYLEYSTNLPSAIGSLTGITDKLVDDVTNVEITISDMDAEIGEARKGKTTLEERLEEDRTNILKTIGQVDITKNGDIASQLKDVENDIKNLDDIKINKKVKYYTSEETTKGANPNNALEGCFVIAHELNPVQNGFCYYEQFFYGDISETANRIQYVTTYNGDLRRFIRRYFNGNWETKELATTEITEIGLLNGWEKDYGELKITKTGGVCYLNFQGTVGVSSVGTTIFNIPEGFRPKYQQVFYIPQRDGKPFYGVAIDTNGNVDITGVTSLPTQGTKTDFYMMWRVD